MKKLALKVEELEVQTFDTTLADGERGTVEAMGTRATRCYSECNACTFTNCMTDERTEIDCAC